MSEDALKTIRIYLKCLGLLDDEDDCDDSDDDDDYCHIMIDKFSSL